MSHTDAEMKIITESQIKRLETLVRDMVKEGTDIRSVSGSLIGTGIELLIRGGVPDETITKFISDTIIPEIRRITQEGLTEEEAFVRYKIPRSS